VKGGWLAVFAAAALALAARSLHVWQIYDAPFFELRLGDAEAYHAWARSIAAGDWAGHEIFYQAPLYPYFLAAVYGLIGDSVATVRIVHAFLGAASCGLLSFAGWKKFGRRGLIAGALLAIYPPAIFLDGLLDKTALSTTLLCALLALFAARRWFAAGAALGLLALTRENALLLAIPILVWAPSRARVQFAATALVVLLGVGARNLAVGGEFHVTTAQSGPNLYIGNHPGAPGWYEALVAGHGSAADERDDAARLARQARGRSLGPGEVSRYWSGRALEFIRSHPVEWLRLMARKVALTFNNAEIADTESQDVYAEWSWLLRLPLGFGVLLAAAILNWRGDRSLWAMAATYGLGIVVFFVLARYRFPLVPFLLLLAVSIPRRPSRGAIVGALAALGVAFIPLVDPSLGRATNYYAIATAFSRDTGRLAESEAFFRRALDVNSRFPGAHFGLATVLTKLGRPAEATADYEAAIAGWPDHQEARYNYGHALAALGRLPEAVVQYQAAVQLRPDDAAARIALAQTLLGVGRLDEAIPQFESALKLDPSNASAHANLGAILANQGRIADALPHFERAVALSPDNQQFRQNLEMARRQR
jgi:Flp pilus assembly protein TadD